MHQPDSNKLGVVIAFASENFLGNAPPCGLQVGSLKDAHWGDSLGDCPG